MGGICNIQRFCINSNIACSVVLACPTSPQASDLPALKVIIDSRLLSLSERLSLLSFRGCK